jgi:nucleoid DNA-binding protein
MMDLSVISVLLRQLLRTHNRVSLPGLGAFMVDLTPATIIKGGRAMCPPSKRIVFSTAEVWNDGLLEQALAKDQGYTQEGAQKQMAAFSQKLIEQLAAGRRVEFPELGMLRMTADKEWRFTPFEPVDMDADSFGLLELEMTPLTPRPSEPSSPVTKPPVLPYMPPNPLPPIAEPPTRRRCSVVCWVLLVLLLLVVGGFVFRRPIVDYIERTYYTPQELAYLRGQTVNTENPATTPPPAPVNIPAPVVKPETGTKPGRPEPAPVFKERTRHHNVFHILLAQFDNESEATAYTQRIKDSSGYSAEVIHADENVYKVSVLHYSSQQEAEEILAGLKSTDGSEFHNAWVEKY